MLKLGLVKLALVIVMSLFV